MKNAELAGLLFALDHNDEHESVADAMGAWGRWRNSLSHPPWAGGQHTGDCTKVPMTCNRCLVEGFEEAAGRLLEEAELGTFRKLGAALDILLSSDENTERPSE